MIHLQKRKDFSRNLAKINAARFSGVVEREVRKGLVVSASLVERRVVVNIKRGRPEWSPLHPVTFNIRRSRGFRGRRILVQSGGLSRSISVEIEKFEALIGLIRTAKVRGLSKANLARMLERGYAISITPKMRTFLKAHGMRLAFSTRSLHVPPRPFLQPALDESKVEITDIFYEVARRILYKIGV